MIISLFIAETPAMAGAPDDADDPEECDQQPARHVCDHSVRSVKSVAVAMA
jgi:hypothetical protein